MLRFRTGDLVLKTPAGFAISFGLGIVSHKVFSYQRSSFALLTTMSSEMRQWQSFLYHALASAQFFAIIIYKHLVGSFGTLSRCSDEVSR